MDSSESTDVHDDHVRDVYGKSTQVRNSSIHDVHSDVVDVNQSTVRSVTATDLKARQTAMGYTVAATLEATSSAVGIAQVTDASLNASSYSFVVMASGDVKMDQGGALTVVTRQINEAHASAFGAVVAGSVAMRDSTVGILIARNVEGHVTPQLDTRGAIIAGAVAGALVSLVSFAAIYLRGRKSG